MRRWNLSSSGEAIRLVPGLKIAEICDIQSSHESDKEYYMYCLLVGV
jgi:hypothetical protein